MLFHTWGQSHVFLGMMYAGLAVGACFDMISLASRLMDAGRPLQAVLDGVFGLLLSAILILSMVRTNFGEMRVYLILGALSGLVLYAYTIHPLLRAAVVRPARWLIRQARRLFSTDWAKKLFG